MAYFGIVYDVRSANNPVTPTDLATHDILILGWNNAGNISGVSASVLAQGITGGIILGGHDLDFHTVNGGGGNAQQAAQTMFIQAIDYVLKGSGTGLITLGCTDGFPYLPSQWGITPSPRRSEIVSDFTTEGLASGVFEGLTPVAMSGWGASYHDVFDIADAPDFVAFELGASASDFVTVARMTPLHLEKSAELFFGDFALPGEDITYHIQFGNLCSLTAANVELIDNLPPEVIFVSASNGGAYDSQAPRVTWHIDALEPHSELTYHVTARVAQSVRPLTPFTNCAEIHARGFGSSYASVTTDVGFWGTEIIYVKWNAEGGNNGTSWTDAYMDLQDALAGARTCGDLVSAIWVVAGTYKPVWTMETGYKDKSFELVDDIAIYGHFAGSETSISQRDFTNGANETILDGRLGSYSSDAVQYVIRGNNLTSALIDGFTIQRSGGNGSAGVRLTNSGLTMSNCKLSNNRYGVYAQSSSSVDIDNCLIDSTNTSATAGVKVASSQAHIRRSRVSGDNLIASGVNCDSGSVLMEGCVVSGCTSSGVYCYSGSLTVDRCVIRDNTSVSGYGWGVNSNAGLTITNCWIYGNKYGIRYGGTTSIRNNTIVNNTLYGVCRTAGTAAISNCIVWGNATDLEGCSATDSWTSNEGLPGFVNAEGDNYHLAAGSGCIDTGNTTYYNEYDIDGEPRVLDGDGIDGARVDKGADEYFDTPANFIDGDEEVPIVNLLDYAVLANSWLEEDSEHNLVDPLVIDADDLERFAADWPCRIYLDTVPLSDIPQFGQMTGGEGEGMMMGLEAMAMESLAEPIPPDPNTAAEVLDYLDDAWQNDLLPETVTEETYLDFRAVLEGWLE